MIAARVFKLFAQVTISLVAYSACPAVGGTILGLGATNGYVSALTVRGDTLYVGGRFTWAGPACGGALELEQSTLSPLQNFPRVAGVVHAMVADGAGGWYVGGVFTGIGGQPRRHVAHVLADGSVSPWNPDPDLPVKALAKRGSTLYLGGEFAQFAGQPRRCVAAVNTDTGSLTPLTTTFLNYVHSLAANDSLLFIGSGSELTVLDAITGQVRWRADCMGYIDAIALAGNTVYIGGMFGSVYGVPRTRLAALDISNGQLASWNPGADSEVRSLQIDGDVCWVSGHFFNIGGVPRRGVAALDRFTGQALPWNAGISSYVVRGAAVTDSTVYVAGFSGEPGYYTGHFVAFDRVTAQISGSRKLNDLPHMVVASETTVFVGGDFTGYEGAPRQNAAAFDLRTGELTSWAPNPDHWGVKSIAANGPHIILGGHFQNIAGQARRYLAAVDAVSGALTSWAPTVDNMVDAISVHGGHVYVGGYFTIVGGQARRGVMRLDRTSGALDSWDPQCGGAVRSFAFAETTVFVGGGMVTMGGLPRKWLAEVSLATGAVTPWNPPEPDLSVIAITKLGDVIYVGGMFGKLGATTRQNLAAVDAVTGAVLPWNPAASGIVHSVHGHDGAVYVGGSYTEIGGAQRMFLAALDPTTGLADPWRSDANGVIYAILPWESKLLVGGVFTHIGWQGQPGVAELTTRPPVLGVMPDARPSSEWSLVGVYPNPARGGRVELNLELAAVCRLSAEVLDLAGRRVRTLAREQRFTPGHVRLEWDGRDATGSQLPGGLYLVRVREGMRSEVRRVVLTH